MNLNQFPEELKQEEQRILEELIARMDRVIMNLDAQMREYVEESKNADISLNPDLYVSKLLAQRGIRDTAENRKQFIKARDELYRTRFLLHYVDDEGKEDIEELKVGLHSCRNGAEDFVISWEMPLCRHFLLDNSSVDFESIVKDKYGEKYHTYYTLIAKNQVTLRFTRVVKALNIYPGILDDDTIQKIRKNGFLSDSFLDELIGQFNPDEDNLETATQIISDEFLQELLERRSTPDFKNIVFSIQKKQGEIIQAPYHRNMVVQGCAGSGKSMILLHRLPILLYDNPNSLSRTNLYIITPSQMYIQLAENMRYQLEISDINMGTIEQYYDYCIGKYTGHRAGEYGKINYSKKLSSENEQYIYSERCLIDIQAYFTKLLEDTEISLDKAYAVFLPKKNGVKTEGTVAQSINNRIIELQAIMNANNDVLAKYYIAIRDVLNALYSLSATIHSRKDRLILCKS